MYIKNVLIKIISLNYFVNLINPNKPLLFLVTSVKLVTSGPCNFVTLYLWTKYVFFSLKRVKFISRSQTKIDKYESNK